MNLNLRPCPICDQPMTLRPIGVNEKRESMEYFFIYCRHCGYGPNEAYNSIAMAAKSWEESCLKRGI